MEHTTMCLLMEKKNHSGCLTRMKTPLVIYSIQEFRFFLRENSRAGWTLWSGQVLNFEFLRGCNESSVNYDRTPSCDYISNERSGVPCGMRSLSLCGRHNNTMAKSWRRLFARRRRAQDMRPQDKKNNEFAGAYSCPVLGWNDV